MQTGLQHDLQNTRTVPLPW